MNGLSHPTFKPASHVADEFRGEHVPGSQIYTGVIQRKQYAMHFPVSITFANDNTIVSFRSGLRTPGPSVQELCPPASAVAEELRAGAGTVVGGDRYAQPRRPELKSAVSNFRRGHKQGRFLK
jgi:hypothetical protein